MDRKNFFADGLREMAGDLIRTPLGKLVDQQLHGISNLLAPEWLNDRVFGANGTNHSLKERRDSSAAPKKPETTVHARPPGALVDPKKFAKACTRCNDCILACPHGTLFNLDAFSGPVVDPNKYPCHLCQDWPCIKSCETGALTKLPPNTYPGFGMAVLILNKCLNEPENRIERNSAKKREPYCRNCEKSCPIEAVKLTKEKLPEFEDFCTGCGLCVRACPSDPVAIHVIV